MSDADDPLLDAGTGARALRPARQLPSSSGGWLRRTTPTRSGAQLRERGPVHRRHRPRADRDWTAPPSSTACRIPTARTSRPSATRPATRPTATRGCSPRRRIAAAIDTAEVRPSTACCPWAARSIAATARWSSRRSCRRRRSGGSATGSSRPCTLLIDDFEGDGRAELNVDFCAAIPVLTITGSFGVPVEQALDIRARAPSGRPTVVEIIAPIVAARREAPQDDLISVLVEAELTDEDGTTHRLTDAEIYSFAAAAARRRFGHHVEADGHHARRAAAAARGARSGDRGPRRCCAPRSRSRCAGRRPTRCSRGGSPTTSTSSASTSRRVRSAPLPRRGNRDPTAGTTRRVRHLPRRRSRRSPSAAARTSASACMSPGPRCSSASARCSTGSPTCGSTPMRSAAALRRLLRARGHRDPGALRVNGAMSDALLPAARPHPPRRGARPALPARRTARSGYLWNGVPTAAPHHDRPQDAASRAPRRSSSAVTAMTTSSSPRWVGHRSTRTGT